MIGSSGPAPSRPEWPGGAPFAFAIIDDTDKTTLENGPLVYDVLNALAVRVTKTVWPVAPTGPTRTGGSTCADPAYLAWVLWLFIHILYLAGFRNRLSVMLEWGYSFFTYERGARLITTGHGRAKPPLA